MSIIAVIQVGVAIIQIIVGIYMAFLGSKLKKTEIKFSRYNELNIVALRKLYHQLSVMKYYIDYLFDNSGSIDHNKYKKMLNTWVKLYFENSIEFSKEMILLNEELKKKYLNSIDVFKEVKTLFKEEVNDLELFEEYNECNYNRMYGSEFEELEDIGNKIKKIAKNKCIDDMICCFKNLNKSIEKSFKEMNS